MSSNDFVVVLKHEKMAHKLVGVQNIMGRARLFMTITDPKSKFVYVPDKTTSDLWWEYTIDAAIDETDFHTIVNVFETWIGNKEYPGLEKRIENERLLAAAIEFKCIDLVVHASKDNEERARKDCERLHIPFGKLDAAIACDGLNSDGTMTCKFPDDFDSARRQYEIACQFATPNQQASMVVMLLDKFNDDAEILLHSLPIIKIDESHVTELADRTKGILNENLRTFISHNASTQTLKLMNTEISALRDEVHDAVGAFKVMNEALTKTNGFRDHVAQLVNIPYNESQQFRGIFDNIQEMTGKLVTKSGIVTISGTKPAIGDYSYLTNYNEHNDFETVKHKFPYIDFEFHNVYLAQFTHYVIQTNFEGTGGAHLRSWEVQGRKVGSKSDDWVTINKQENNTDLNESYKIQVFPVKCNFPLEAIRIQMTGSAQNNSPVMKIKLFEIFGNLQIERLRFNDIYESLTRAQSRLSETGHGIIKVVHSPSPLMGLFHAATRIFQTDLTEELITVGPQPEAISLLLPCVSKWKGEGPFTVEFCQHLLKLKAIAIRTNPEGFTHPKKFKLTLHTTDDQQIKTWSDEQGCLNSPGVVHVYPMGEPVKDITKITLEIVNHDGTTYFDFDRFEIFGTMSKKP